MPVKKTRGTLVDQMAYALYQCKLADDLTFICCQQETRTLSPFQSFIFLFSVKIKASGNSRDSLQVTRKWVL